MNSAQILERCGECIAAIGGTSREPWTAAQFRQLSRELNLLIADQWGVAPCAHEGETYTTKNGKHCGFCLRRLGETNEATEITGS